MCSFRWNKQTTILRCRSRLNITLIGFLAFTVLTSRQQNVQNRLVLLRLVWLYCTCRWRVFNTTLYCSLSIRIVRCCRKRVCFAAVNQGSIRADSRPRQLEERALLWWLRFWLSPQQTGNVAIIWWSTLVTNIRQLTLRCSILHVWRHVQFS